MGTMTSQITSLTIVYSTQIKENIKAPRHWPLCGEFTGDRWIPAQMANNAENVSIWWRHHVAVTWELAGKMFLLCYSPEDHRLFLNTRNNSTLLAIEIDMLQNRFLPSKTVVKLVSFTCKWPNLQLDPPSVASLCRLVVIQSMASCVIRHGHKSVAGHSWNFYLMQIFAESHMLLEVVAPRS